MLQSSLLVAMFAFVIAVPAAELSAGLKALQGKWAAERKGRDGDLYKFTLEFKAENLTFEAKDAGGETRLVAKGKAKAEKSGAFNVLSLTDIRAGRTADDLQERDDTRTSVYTLREDKLYLASNFDRERENETPRVDEYTRVSATADAGESKSVKLAGAWNADVALADQKFDYKLRIEKGGEGFQTTFVSPRSGEHKARSTMVKGDDIEIQIDRDIQGNNATFVYKGKLAQDKISGTVSVKGLEDQFTGTWTASR